MWTKHLILTPFEDSPHKCMWHKNGSSSCSRAPSLGQNVNKSLKWPEHSLKNVNSTCNKNLSCGYQPPLHPQHSELFQIYKQEVRFEIVCSFTRHTHNVQIHELHCKIPQDPKGSVDVNCVGRCHQALRAGSEDEGTRQQAADIISRGSVPK